ncbi:MAG: hypothetical protein ACOYXT_11765 [Bacteroidota bacterium]
MLPLDNAPGGASDITSAAGELPVKLNITRFCFVPTYSALDIGGGLQPINANDLTKACLPANPPRGAKQIMAHSFFANPSKEIIVASAEATTNEIHTQLTQQNATWLFHEIQMKPTPLRCRYACNASELVIAGPDNVCQTNAQPFEFGEPTTSSNITWEATPPELFLTSSGMGSTALLQPHPAMASREAQITFTLKAPNPECDAYMAQKKFLINKPLPEPVITFSHSHLSAFADVQVFTEAPPPYYWYVGYRLAAIDHVGALRLPLTGCGRPLISVKVANACGTVQSGDYPQNRVDYCSWSVIPHPNPSSNELIVSVSTDDSGLSSDQSIINNADETYNISLYGPTQEKVFETTTTETNVAIPVSNLPDGVYIVHVSYKDSFVQRHVLIERE